MEDERTGISMPRYGIWVVLLSLTLLPCDILAQAQSARPPIRPGIESELPQEPGTPGSSGEQHPEQSLSGSIRGAVVDQTGTAVVGAQVRLTREDQSPNQEVLTGDDGQFSFSDTGPGPFHLTIESAGFATQTFSGVLNSGEIYAIPQTTLAIATAITEVRVVPSRTELAAVPLSSRQKFELAWKTTVDPVSFGLTGAIAGIQQAQNDFSGYGQGAQGYAKRYGASYADFLTGTLIGSAILPSLLKQDPRYFYKGSGSKRSRIAYAIANAVICKGDNGHWQASYSSILGSLAAGGISNLYYPAKDRGAELTFENALIGTGATAVTNLLQEFVIRRLTPSASNRGQAKTQSTSSNASTTFVHVAD